MSFGFSVGDLIAAGNLASKLPESLRSLSAVSDELPTELPIELRGIQLRVEALNQRWIRTRIQTPSPTTLAAIKKLTESIAELLKRFERLGKRSTTSQDRKRQIKKVQSMSSEIQKLLDDIQDNIQLEEATDAHTFVEFNQRGPLTNEAGGIASETEALSSTKETDTTAQKRNKSSTSLSPVVHNLILVHGLAAHAHGTWAGVESNWPDDLYPRTFPKSRVFIYRYDSATLVTESFTRNVVREARDLIGYVVDRCKNAPIIFCTQGIGGHIVKTALVYAFHAQIFDHSCAIFIKYVRGLLLYGLPDLSLPFALEMHIANLHVIGVLRKSDFMSKVEGELYCPSTHAFSNEDFFARITHGHKISVVYYFERLPVMTSHGPILVTEPSANFSPQHVKFLDGNHFTMCQFQTETDDNYIKLCQLMLTILTNGQSGQLVPQYCPPSNSSRRRDDEKQGKQLLSGIEIDDGENTKLRSIPLHNTDLNDLLVNYTERFRAFCKQLQPSVARWRTPLVPYKNCAWIEESHLFGHWNTLTASETGYEEQKLLVIRGSPGSGKSTLLHYILNRFVRYKYDGNPVTMVISHWCSRHHVETLTFSHIIRSFLWQLLSVGAHAFQAVYTSWLELPEKPDELLSLLSQLLTGFSSQSLLFLLDGIDEVEEEQEGLLTSMWDLFRNCSTAKVIFTSGDEPGRNHFMDKLSIEITPSIILLPFHVDNLLPDTRNLVDDLIEDLSRSCKLTDTIQKEILDVVLSKCQGNYQWIVLFFRTVAQLGSVGRIQTFLPQVSSHVSSLYDQLLTGQPESLKGDLCLLFHTIEHSFEPLSPEELLTVMAIVRADDLEYVERDHLLDLKFLLGPLIGPIINLDAEKVVFAHDSFSAYLRDSSCQTLQPHNHQDFHSTLAVACVSWLEFHGSKVNNPEGLNLTQVPFLLYAARYWHQHCRKAVDPIQSLLAVIHKKILNLGPDFLEQIKPYAKLDVQIPGNDENIFNFAAAIGLELNLETIQKIDCNFDPKTAVWDGPMLRAFTNRHTSTLSQILELSMDRKFFRNTLVAALKEAKSSSSSNFSRFVIGILDVTFDKDDLVNDLTLAPTILQLALRHRRWKLVGEAFRTLSGHDSVAKASWKDTDGPNILCEAISTFQHHQNDVLQIEHLFALGLRLDIPASTGEIPLHTAVKNGFFSSINDPETYLDNVNVTNKTSQTALHLAAEAGFMDIVQELTSLNADTNALDNKKMTPLHFAALYGHKEVVQFLLSVGSSSDIQDIQGRTPLLMAAAGGETDIMESLFRQGADISVADQKGQTPLHLAAYNWCQQLATRLLKWSPSDVNVRDSSGCSPLHASASRGLDTFTELLLNARADPTALDHSGRSALHYAAESQYLSDSLIQLFVRHGNDPNLKDKYNLSPIDLAQKANNNMVVQRLKKLVDQPSKAEATVNTDPVTKPPAIMSRSERPLKIVRSTSPRRRPSTYDPYVMYAPPPPPVLYDTRSFRASEGDLGRRSYGYHLRDDQYAFISRPRGPERSSFPRPEFERYRPPGRVLDTRSDDNYSTRSSLRRGSLEYDRQVDLFERERMSREARRRQEELDYLYESQMRRRRSPERSRLRLRARSIERSSSTEGLRARSPVSDLEDPWMERRTRTRF